MWIPRNEKVAAEHLSPGYMGFGRWKVASAGVVAVQTNAMFQEQQQLRALDDAMQLKYTICAQGPLFI